MNLSAEQIQSNWETFLDNIKTHISDKKDRKDKLLNFYNKYEERIILMPAAHKKEYHGAFPGGYVAHVNRVVKGSLKLYDMWEEMGCDMTTFTKEELCRNAPSSIFSKELGKLMLFRFLQYAKQYSGRLLSSGENVISFRLEQPEKASMPISFISADHGISSSLRHILKAKFPI